MELPFNIIELINIIDEKPIYLVAFASLHGFVFILLHIPIWLFKKIGIYDPNKNLGVFGTSIAFIIGIGWVLGFISQGLLFFMKVSGIKMLLIYLSMYLCIIAFVISNATKLKNNFNINGN